MSEAELHIIRARLDGGIRNKAARGAPVDAVIRNLTGGPGKTSEWRVVQEISGTVE